MSRIPLAVLLVASGAGVASAQGSPARWTVGPNATVTIGANETDTASILNEVIGATRLADGRILVGDKGSFALRLFSADGKPLRSFGRKGQGPGEIGYLKTLLHCGDSIVTLDIDGQRVSVFSPRGEYVRSFRFGSAQPGRSPYQSKCNAGGVFAHHGWETMNDVKGGIYRPVVPFWFSGADSGVRRVIGSFPGSERFGMMAKDRVAGARPLPLGKQTAIALGSDRVYIGPADRYEILVFDTAGNALAPIRAARQAAPVRAADIEYVKAQELSLVPPARLAVAEHGFEAIEFPKTLPAYRSLVVDVDGNLWVQDYPRGATRSVSWSVFNPQGQLVAQTQLPTYVDVYEIGKDYVLGRYLDPEESIPQVRLYRLDRGTVPRR